ncbi:glycosyltransferase 87 family protein [Streptomyces sp. A13(2022)]|uniref:glycosyltransferase 87 family protein n=1 Tax=Streptomyces sp. A13(2022) TaxID=2964768 RepID=UPI0021D98E00|nr:glycosyltransferase 87 family protein [Streptomyces sp. A13(2022)]MCU8593210.1 glycosyltransferase 87 family protein [Streptomyces sp. A13(2022)]
MVARSAGRSSVWLVAVWGATRLLLLLFVLKVLVFPGPDVTSDVSVIYRDWYEVLRTGTFPSDDVTWQYPPAAAFAILSPALLPFLEYATAFFVLACAVDAAVLALLWRAGRGSGRSPRGAWVWVVGVPLLGPTVYARYDLMVTAVAVAALLAAGRHARVAGALAAVGALLKVWPALVLVGMGGRRPWVAAAVGGAGLAGLFAVTMPGAFAFLTFQRERGVEVESLGALVFHVARHFGWEGGVLLNYGSMEFLGPHVDTVSTVSMGLSAAAFGWLLLWRVRAARSPGPRSPRSRSQPPESQPQPSESRSSRSPSSRSRFAAHTAADAAFVAVLLFTVTSRVISPQYLVWLVGLAAVCRCFRASRMRVPVALVLAASLVTVLEFPLLFADVVASTPLGIALLAVRNGLLVAAALVGARALWRDTVRRGSAGGRPGASGPGISRAPSADSPATAG